MKKKRLGRKERRWDFQETRKKNDTPPKRNQSNRGKGREGGRTPSGNKIGYRGPIDDCFYIRRFRPTDRSLSGENDKRRGRGKERSYLCTAPSTKPPRPLQTTPQDHSSKNRRSEKSGKRGIRGGGRSKAMRKIGCCTWTIFAIVIKR